MPLDPKTRLTLTFPNLQVTSVEKIGEGWDNEAFLVNNTIVFRLPKERALHYASEQAEHTRVEIGLLGAMKDKLPVTIPDIMYVSPDNAFYGYTYLPGSQLSIDGVLRTKAERHNFIKTWVETAVAIERSISPQEATQIGLVPFPHNEYRLKRLREAITSGVLDDSLTELAEYTANEYMAHWNSARQLVVHGDLGLGNWVYNPDKCTYAVIDWSDACIAPQEFQMYRLLNDLPDEIELITRLYQGATSHEINRELIYLCGNRSILSVIGAEVTKNGPASILLEEKISQLRAWALLQGWPTLA